MCVVQRCETGEEKLHRIQCWHLKILKERTNKITDSVQVTRSWAGFLCLVKLKRTLGSGQGGVTANLAGFVGTKISVLSVFRKLKLIRLHMLTYKYKHARFKKIIPGVAGCSLLIHPQLNTI